MIADSVIMGLLSALGFGLAEFASALLARRTSHFRLIFGVNLASVISAAAYAPIDGQIVHASAVYWLTAVGLGVLYTATYFLYYAALQRGPVSLVSPIMSVYKGVVIILAVIILAERMSLGQSAGAAAALLGVFLASTNVADLKDGRVIIGRGVIFGLLAMLAFGVFYYSIAALSRDLGWFLPVFMIRMFTALFAAPIAFKHPGSPAQPLTPKLVPSQSSPSAPSKSPPCSLSPGALRWASWPSLPPSPPPTPSSPSSAPSSFSANDSAPYRLLASSQW